MRANPLLIAETESISAIARDWGDDEVVIVFAHLATVHSDFTLWNDQFIADEGLSSIGIVTSRHNYYPPTEMGVIVERVLRHLNGRKTVTYGFSQGGYGALKYSRRLNAKVALAFSPQWSINPDDASGFDTNYTRCFDGTLQNGLRIERQDLADIGFCVFDSNDYVDALHAKHLLEIDTVKGVVAPFTWHGSIHLLAEAKMGGTILRYCLRESSPSTERIRGLLRSARPHSQSYLRIARCRLLERLVRARKQSSAAFLQRINSRCAEGQALVRSLIACVWTPLKKAPAR